MDLREAPSLLFALALTTSTVACSRHHHDASFPPSGGEAPVFTSWDAWRSAMSAAPLPQAGCFRVAFPSTVWQPIACSAAPQNPANVGSTHDFSAQVPGHISSAVGSFWRVDGVTNETGPQFGSGCANQGSVPDTYSLQLNASSFNSTTSGSAQQFVFGVVNGVGELFIQSWLFHPASCPTGWTASGSNCYFTSPSASNAIAPIANLASFTMTAIAAPATGGNDTVVLSTGNGQPLLAVADDSAIHLATWWNTAEFNVFGNFCSSMASFNTGSTIVVSTSVHDGTTNAPLCIGPSNGGVTRETNNLDLLNNCCSIDGGSPQITFTESNAVSPQTCPCGQTLSGGVCVPVGPCSALPAPGTWTLVTPPGGVTETDALVVDPLVSSTVWLGTRGTGLFKSADCGAHWMQVNTGQNGTSMQTGAIQSMAVDPVQAGAIYATAVGGSEGLWKSSNGGIDWVQLFPPGSNVAAAVPGAAINSIAMDPLDHTHLVVSMHAACVSPYGTVCLAESKDAGATWRVFTVAAPGTHWTQPEPGAGVFILGASTFLFGTTNDGLWLTTDDGVSWSNVTPTGTTGATGGGLINQPMSASAAGIYYMASRQGISKSLDGRTWSLIPSSPASTLGFVLGGGALYASNGSTLGYSSALQNDDSVWTPVGPPPPPVSSQGGAYLSYDRTRRLLYSSNLGGGAWRLVTP